MCACLVLSVCVCVRVARGVGVCGGEGARVCARVHDKQICIYRSLGGVVGEMGCAAKERPFAMVCRPEYLPPG